MLNSKSGKHINQTTELGVKIERKQISTLSFTNKNQYMNHLHQK